MFFNKFENFSELSDDFLIGNGFFFHPTIENLIFFKIFTS